MCGIAGILHFGNTAHPALLRRGMDCIRHRGPDGSGMVALVDGRLKAALEERPVRLLLGHLRLAILDRSDAGSQPMIDPLSGDAIVFNGEIYNFLELREDLLRDNPRTQFHSDSDTEVLLKGWQRWGEGVFQRANGMWSVLIYDAARQELIAARDRMGVKPLYLFRNERGWHFASEIPALLAMTDSPPTPDPIAVFDYLLAGIVDSSPNRTFYAGVHAIPPGELWRIPLVTLKPEAVRYHSFDTTIDDSPSQPEDLIELLDNAVAIRLRSDAPTASLLSGGLDSPLITTLASRHAGDIRTRFEGAYTYAYTGDDASQYDESERAARIAQSCFPTLPHHTFRTSPELSMDDMDRFFRVQAEPATTPSFIAGLKIYGHLRHAGLRVALSSEGADEMFAGYPRPYLSRKMMDALLQQDVREFFSLLRSPHTRMRDLMSRINWHLPHTASRWMLRRLRRNVRGMADDFWHDMQPRLIEMMEDRRQPLASRIQRDVLSTLLPHVLRCADRNSMANSLEVRTPFLDYRIVQYALRRPPHEKITGAGTKLMLRSAARKVLPPFVTDTPKVLGFGHAEQHHLPPLRQQWKERYESPAARAFVTFPNDSDAESLEDWWLYSVARWATEQTR